METTPIRIAGDRQRAISRKVHFTKAVLDALACPEGKSYISIYDAKQPGLMLLCTANGAKTFYCYRKVNGRPQRLRLGAFPAVAIDQARTLTLQTTAQIASGVDPLQERQRIRSDATLGEVWDRWLNEHAKPRLRARTIETDKSRWETCFTDWTNRKLHSIQPADVQRKLEALGKSKGHTTANRAVQLLRRLMTYAKVQPNPCAKGEIRFFREQPRERFLSGEEMTKLLAAIEAEPNETIADFAKLCFWTGQRRGNVASMEWAEVDLNRAWWVIPATKFKTHKPLAVPLVQPAMDVLTARQNNGSTYVFPGPGKTGHLEEPKTGWKRILEAAGLNDVHLHDLRHNVASWAVQQGASLQAVGKVLGHANIATTQRYAHLAIDPLRATLETGTNAMLAAVEAEKSKLAANRAKEKTAK